MRPEDLELLLIREMPFGKHKGCVIADLPGNYLNWFAREEPSFELAHLSVWSLAEAEAGVSINPVRCAHKTVRWLGSRS